MKSIRPLTSNFAVLGAHDEQFLRIGMLAERYFTEDPNTCLLKLRQLVEVLAQATATHVGLYLNPEESQYDLLIRLRDRGILPPEIYPLFGELRRSGNSANHALQGDHRTALAMLRIAWQIGVWFHRTFHDPHYRSGAFIPPQPPKDESAELRAELSALSKTVGNHQAESQEQAQQLASLSAQLLAAKDEQAFWEQMAAEVDSEKNELQERLASWQASAAA
ncbi:MAG: type restriction protein res subunit [Verrucomicrobiales bacterium]|nr:type restriction protein res subunit [Verrucomicrobiales bacterium]